MSLSINTNLSSLRAQLSLRNSTSDLNRALERLTTGYRINSASDDAAGYAVSTKMETALSSYHVAESNANLGSSLLNTAESSLDIVIAHLQRIRDLAEQAANGTYGEDSINAIQMEIDERTDEINRIMSTTEYNGIKLFETPPDSATGSFITEVTPLTEDEAVAQGYTLIKTAADLDNIRNNLSGKYILMNDIDLSSYSNWVPIGNGSSFTGELNGNGYVIRNMTINNTTEQLVGLFARTDGATISNLGIENSYISSEFHAPGQTCIGVLAGVAMSSQISNCYTTGSIRSIVNGTLDNDLAGGLIGLTVMSNVQNSYSDVDISGTSISGAGGLIGIAYAYDTITNCYASGNVYGNNGAGGLISVANSATISNCYATGHVTYTPSSSSSIGGLIGDTVNGGVAPTIINSYYNMDTTGQSDSNLGSQGVTTSELNQLIENGTLAQANLPKTGRDITLQVGIDSSSNSQISFNTGVSVSINVNVSTTDSARNSLDRIDDAINSVIAKQTEFGAVQNRLDSIIESLGVSIDNTTSSLSTIKDADIAKVSSDFIRAQILQQASATLLTTANQTPSLALNLI